MIKKIDKFEQKLKIKIKNKSELDQLMSKADYDKFAKDNPN